MIARPRIAMLLALLACGAALIGVMLRGHLRSPLASTLATPFQLLGTPVKLVDRMASRVVPVSALDERDLGDVFRRRYDSQVQPNDRDQAYLDKLLAELSKFSHKPFHYRAYAIGSFGVPNAMALPGGVILVTRELFDAIQSESELVSVLAHEIGHIELGHCFDMVRFELLARKVGSQTLGDLADVIVQILLRLTFSKTVEDEADMYAYELVVNSQYDPLGVGNSFGSLLRFQRAHGVESQQHAEPFRDYFMSHPPLEIREAKFHEQAVVWWKGHPDARRYVGQQNLKDRTAFSVRVIANEWTSKQNRM